MACSRSQVLRFEAVTRRYGATLALDGVSLALEPGRLTVLTGENGAGKSTLLRIGAGLERPSAGLVSPEAAQRRSRLGWLGQEPGLYDALTVRENLAFAARLFGHEANIDAAAATTGIATKLDARASALSRGEKQRAALARALLCGDVLLLDEPTSALDADAAQRCSDALVALRGERTMLVATHDAELVKRADRLVRLRAGRLEP